MTEEEAKTKWCPFVRYLAIFRSEDGKRECAGSYNRGAQDSAIGNAPCLGSACMAWRESADAYSAAYEAWEDAANIGGVVRGPEPLLSDFGYCGLAGPT